MWVIQVERVASPRKRDERENECWEGKVNRLHPQGKVPVGEQGGLGLEE